MKFIMNFLRSPFQFRSTEQSSKKSESASPVVENMFIDPTTGISTDPRWRASSPGIGASSSVSGSPRLQHRVPGFENNGNSPIEVIREPTMSHSSSNEDGEKPPRVRVVPIKVESVDDSSSPKKRPGAFHSSSGTIPRSSQFGPLHPNFEELHNRKRHSSGPAASQKKSDPAESKPKVCNIPIFVEGRDTPVVPRASPSSQNVPVHNVTPTPDKQATTAKQNGGNLTKCASKTTKSKQGVKQNNCEVSLKQISNILSEFQTLKTGVDEFKGDTKDKHYRYLDEMLTRCMLKLDNVETHGDDEVRAARKAAVKAIEKCITDLESHAQANTKSGQSADQEENHSPPEPANSAKEEEMNVSQDETADQTEEKYVPSKVTNVTKKEETNVSLEQTAVSVCEGIQKTEGDSASSSVPNDRSAAEQSNTTSDNPSCSESRPGSSETVQTSAENIEFMDANQNSGDIADKPMDVDETVTEKLEVTEERTLVQVDQPVEDPRAPEHLAKTSSKPMEATQAPSQYVDLPKQNEPMDSDEVPEAKVKLDSGVKGETADSEMVELTKEPVSAENKNPAEICN